PLLSNRKRDEVGIDGTPRVPLKTVSLQNDQATRCLWISDDSHLPRPKPSHVAVGCDVKPGFGVSPAQVTRNTWKTHLKLDLYFIGRMLIVGLIGWTVQR